MKQVQGVWLPDHEQHLTEWMTKHGELVDGKGTYQIKKLRRALQECRRFQGAIDVGAHCGLWSMQLAKAFTRVDAFEPIAAHRDCFKRNVTAPNVKLWPCAVGDGTGDVFLQTEPGSSGNTGVTHAGNWLKRVIVSPPVRLVRLDDEIYLPVDFIKIDCEGYELPVLRGAEELIRAWHPTVCVEQKPGHAQRYGFGEREAVNWLIERGYKVAVEMSGDFIMVPA